MKLIVKARIEQVRSIFTHLINKEVTISFGTHTLNATLVGVENQAVTGFTLAPPKRVGEDGKTRSPTLIKLVFDQGSFVFDDEVTQFIPIFNGIRCTVTSKTSGKSYDVVLRLKG